MRLRNGPDGYGLVTKGLHWLTVAAMAGQFSVGYAMDDDGVAEVDCDNENDRLEEQCEARQESREDASDDAVGTAFSDLGSGDLFDGGLSLPETHVVLGIVIIVLGLVRVLWRSTTPLPPWAEVLNAAERRLEGLLEKVLLSLLFLVPGSGLLLVLGNDDWLPVHIGAHVLFFVTLALHVGLVLRHTMVRRERQLLRML